MLRKRLLEYLGQFSQVKLGLKRSPKKFASVLCVCRVFACVVFVNVMKLKFSKQKL